MTHSSTPGDKNSTLTSAGTAMRPHNCGNPRAAKMRKAITKSKYNLHSSETSFVSYSDRIGNPLGFQNPYDLNLQYLYRQLLLLRQSEEHYLNWTFTGFILST